ncbi:TIGR04086 family membrane protein [Bacillus sp. NPDC077411]|uniref:TIGR04086 family membrane protein n=1 Tax=Bacillus bruguierae TaxID=3127667 RepID=A0ABU8FBT9_9BACI|nr:MULTISPECIES: TIGR04086 family membrane protein [unclassified Bacillus (in: firmicutes)]SFK02247.1 putative membrane protein, TIGR04086 family [Bacillus sp. 71mf]SFS52412.1 putative membrane protein, TIGR04086 family [Bacillus sp. 103mf]
MDGTRKLSIAVGFGIVTLLIFACLASIIIALLLKFTNINERTLSIALLVLAIVSTVIAGFVAGVKAQGKGWFVGGSTGVVFAILVFLVNYLGFSSALSNVQLLYQLVLIAASTIGGILGVNIGKRTTY